MTQLFDRAVAVTTLAGIVLVTAIVAATATVIAWPSLGRAIGIDAGRRGYRVGDTVDVPAQAYQSTRRTVVMFLRSNCAACQKAKLPLKEVAHAVGSLDDIGVVMINPRGDTHGDSLTREIGTSRAARFELPPAALRVSVVPTVLIVDRQGVITFSHEGPFNELEKIRLLSALSGDR